MTTPRSTVAARAADAPTRILEGFIVCTAGGEPRMEQPNDYGPCIEVAMTREGAQRMLRDEITPPISAERPVDVRRVLIELQPFRADLGDTANTEPSPMESGDTGELVESPAALTSLMDALSYVEAGECDDALFIFLRLLDALEGFVELYRPRTGKLTETIFRDRASIAQIPHRMCTVVELLYDEGHLTHDEAGVFHVTAKGAKAWREGGV